MDERDRERQSIDARPEGTGRLRAGVGMADAGINRLRAGGDRMRDAGYLVRGASEDAAWFLRERVVWPVQDGLDALGPRGQIGVFGGGGIALAGVVAALLIAGGGSGPSAGGTTEAFVIPERGPAPTAVAPAPKPKKEKPARPAGPTLHGAPPDFSPAQDVKAGVGGGKAVGKEAVDGSTGGVAAERGAGDANGKASASSATTGAGDTPASSAKIGATPEASASATARAESLSNDNTSGAAQGTTGPAAKGAGADQTALTGPPAPKAAKRVARHFAEAFVVYETGGVDAKVRNSFRRTTTKQLSKALLERPPRQPAAVKVPRAKVVTVVAGPSKGSVYEVSVSLLRVGVTSELRLAMEQGPGKKWQVTNVLG
jgi:hypothetical protein